MADEGTRPSTGENGHAPQGPQWATQGHQFGGPGGQPGASYPPAGQYPPTQQLPPTSSGGPNKVMIGVIAGLAGLGLIGGGVMVARSWPSGAAPSASPTASQVTGQTATPSASPVATSKASDAVVQYLRALGTGDATTALSLAATPPDDTTFLTNAVLAKATAGKISDIQVPEVNDPAATSVDAAYSLDGQPVTVAFNVRNVNGQFLLERIAAPVDIGDVGTSTAPVTLAGVRAPDTVVSLFPGIYPVGSSNKLYSYGSAKVTVSKLDQQSARGATATLSSAGKSAVIKAVKTTYAACLKKKSLSPGCGLSVNLPSGVKHRANTIKWTTRSGAKWDSAKLKLVGGGIIEGAAKAKVHFYVRDVRAYRYWYTDISITGFRALIAGSKVTVAFY